MAEDVTEAAVVQEKPLEDGSPKFVEVEDEEGLGSIRNAPEKISSCPSLGVSKSQDALLSAKFKPPRSTFQLN